MEHLVVASQFNTQMEDEFLETHFMGKNPTLSKILQGRENRIFFVFSHNWGTDNHLEGHIYIRSIDVVAFAKKGGYT